MKKALAIARKDLLMTFRDRAGLLLMLVAPLALTLVVAFAFGSGSSDTGGISQIPILVVNQDAGSYGQFLVEAFQSEQIKNLVQAEETNDLAAARARIDHDEATALVIIPANFSTSIVPAGLNDTNVENTQGSTSEVVIYANPSRPVTSQVVKTIVDTILERFVVSSVGGQVAVEQLLKSGLLSPQNAQAQGSMIGEQAARSLTQADMVQIERQIGADTSQQSFSWLKYIAPSLAILFLMFSLSLAARTILVERNMGTLPRMLVSPSSGASVLGGKMLGNFLIGLVQMGVLLLANALLFHLSWGDPLAVVLLTLCLVAAVTAWGLVEAAIAQNPSQANAIGVATNLTFAALGGTFVPRTNYPGWMIPLGNITPNAWGTESYFKLMYGGSLQDILPALLALSLMAVVLFAIAVLIFRRRYAFS
jgi:ABC-2 type transport system permease protein